MVNVVVVQSDDSQTAGCRDISWTVHSSGSPDSSRGPMPPRPWAPTKLRSAARNAGRGLLGDTRGGQLFEYLILVGCVALFCVAGWRFFGQSLNRTLECEAHRLKFLDPSDLSACSETAGGSSSPGAAQSGAAGQGGAQVLPDDVPPAGSLEPGAAQGSGLEPPAPPGRSGGGCGSQPAPSHGQTPQQEANQLAQAITVTGGTATAADRAAVLAQVQRIPVEGLRALKAAGIKITVVKNSVVEGLPALRGVQPRGWPPGSTWDTVPGLYDSNTKQVVIATRNGAVPTTGDGHGSASLVVHETAHAIDDATGGHNDPAFLAARNQDLQHLSPYERQPGAAGLQESYAESMAQYASDPAACKATTPALYEYWNSNPLKKP